MSVSYTHLDYSGAGGGWESGVVWQSIEEGRSQNVDSESTGIIPAGRVRMRSVCTFPTGVQG